MPGLDYDETMEDRAERIREYLDIGDDTQPDALVLIERMLNRRTITEYRIVEDETLQGAKALLDGERRAIIVTQSTSQGAMAGETNHRYAYFHEAAHAFLGHAHQRFFKGKIQFGRQTEQDERDAHALALAVMAPYSLANLTENTKAEEIAIRFNLTEAHAFERHMVLMRMYRKRHGLTRQLPEVEPFYNPLALNDPLEHEFSDAMVGWAKPR